MTNRWVVRVVLHHGIPFDEGLLDGPFLLCLHSAGAIRIHRDDDSGVCFDIPAPKLITNERSHTWAKMESERMRSFTFNAEAAPEWKEV